MAQEYKEQGRKKVARKMVSDADQHPYALRALLGRSFDVVVTVLEELVGPQHPE